MLLANELQLVASRAFRAEMLVVGQLEGYKLGCKVQTYDGSCLRDEGVFVSTGNNTLRFAWVETEAKQAVETHANQV
jgi:hypothetical protein